MQVPLTKTIPAVQEENCADYIASTRSKHLREGQCLPALHPFCDSPRIFVYQLCQSGYVEAELLNPKEHQTLQRLLLGVRILTI